MTTKIKKSHYFAKYHNERTAGARYIDFISATKTADGGSAGGRDSGSRLGRARRRVARRVVVPPGPRSFCQNFLTVCAKELE